MSRTPVPAPRPARRRLGLEAPALAALALGVACALAMSWLALARHRSWWTARFDVGNMWQAAWSTAHGDFLATTDAGGEQISRLAAHVDPLLVVFAPLAWVTDSPAPMLVLQCVGVAAGAIPMYLLGRRWLGAGWQALGAAAVYLAYPPVWWLVLDEFHPLAFATPALVTAIWAIEARRDWWLAAAAVVACLSKEEVGLAVAGLGIWMAVRHRRRIAAAALTVGGAVWTALCVKMIIPRYNDGAGSRFVDRYAELGGSEGAIIRQLLTHPWEFLTVGLSPSRVGYLAALLLPLLLLPLRAPLLALAAAPELLLNLLASWPPQHSVEFHYVAVPAGILLPASVLGLSHLLGTRGVRPGGIGVLAAACVGSMLVTGPLPVAPSLSVASDSRRAQYRPGPSVEALRDAAALIPPGAPVSVGNYAGGHLSARDYVATFPVLGRARYVLVDARRPTIGFRLDPVRFRAEVARLRGRPDARVRFDRDGVTLWELTP